MFIAIITLLLFLSGFSTLVHAMAWTRTFGLITGTSALASGTTAAALALGLASGSIIIGRLADRTTQHMRLFSRVEFGAALWAALLLLVQGTVRSMLTSLPPLAGNAFPVFHLLQFLGIFLVTLPATLLLGGALPLLSRMAVRDSVALGRRSGESHGIFALGAAAGSFLTAYILLHAIGAVGTVSLAIATNLTASVLALACARIMKTGQGSTADARTISAPPARRNYGAPLLIVALCAALSLPGLLIWSRLLAVLLSDSSYAWPMLLTASLLGVVAGAMAGGRLADRTQRPLLSLGYIICSLAVSAFIGTVLLVSLSKLHGALFPADLRLAWWQENALRFIEIIIVTAAPAFLLGAFLPLAVKIRGPHPSKIGSVIGGLSLYSTAGAVLGSVIIGSLVLPHIGAAPTVTALVALQLSIALYIISGQKLSLPKAGLYLSPILLLLMLLAMRSTPRGFFTPAYADRSNSYPLNEFREGMESIVTVYKSDRPLEDIQSLKVDGVSIGGSGFMQRTFQVLLGHIPLLLHGNAENVLVAGYGTGQTTRSLLLHPVARVELVDADRKAVALASFHFQELNRQAIRDPRIFYSNAESRGYLLQAGEEYDAIIVSAYPMAGTTGARFFSREYLELCRSTLKSGGFYATGVSLDLDPQDLKVTLKTFQSVFPFCALWMAPNCVNSYAVLLGAREPWTLDFQKIQSRLNDELIMGDLRDIKIGSIYDFIDCLVLDHKGIESICRNAAISSDARPLLELSKNTLSPKDYCAHTNLGAILLRRTNIRELVTNVPDSAGDSTLIGTTIDVYFSAAGLFLQGIVKAHRGEMHAALELLMQGSKMIPDSELAAHIFAMVDDRTGQLSLRASHAQSDLVVQLSLVRHLIGLAHYSNALPLLNFLVKNYPENALVHYEAGRCFYYLENFTLARTHLQRSLDMNSRSSGAWYFSGELYRKQGHTDLALRDLHRALIQDARLYEAHNALGNIYKNKGEYQAAGSHFSSSLALMEYQPDITVQLADCYLQLNNPADAITLYNKTFYMAYDRAALFLKLGIAHYVKADYPQAVTAFKSALALDPGNAELYYNLGNAYVAQDSFPDAVAAFQRAVELNTAHPDYFNNLALAYRESGELSKALEVFHRGLLLHPYSELLIKNAEETRKMSNSS